MLKFRKCNWFGMVCPVLITRIVPLYKVALTVVSTAVLCRTCDKMQVQLYILSWFIRLNLDFLININAKKYHIVSLSSLFDIYIFFYWNLILSASRLIQENNNIEWKELSTIIQVKFDWSLSVMVHWIGIIASVHYVACNIEDCMEGFLLFSGRHWRRRVDRPSWGWCS